MAKRKAPARRRSGAAPKRMAAPKRRAAGRKGAASRKGAARKASARKPARKAKKAAPAAKRAAKKTVKRAAPKATTGRIIRRVVKMAAPAKATARKPVKKLVKKAAPKPAPAPARAVAAKPKAVAAAAGKKKHALGLDRARRIVGDDDDIVSPTPPSSLNLDRSASSARSGRQELKERYDKHTETSPALTGGDVDADWESAYAVGDEAPGGDNPTPDQNNVDDIGLALGVEYADNEELEGADKIQERDRHRWEDDPASSEDFEDR
jgi:hypothetical protein